MENLKVLKLDHTFITGTMKVCWRWCVKDCPVLGNSQELLPTIDITANIIHHKNCQLSVYLSIQGQKKITYQTRNFFSILIFFQNISEMRESTVAVITMVTWAASTTTGLTMGTVGESSGGTGSAESMSLITSQAAGCMATFTAVG